MSTTLTNSTFGKSTTLDEILEAALLAAGEPLSLERLETLFLDGESPGPKTLREALGRLSERHEAGALELVETASGFQLRIRPRLSQWVSRLWDERPQRYSRALLETLALIAYRQPVSRGDIEEVRGVSVSSSIMRTLMERGWIRVVGHRDVPGRPAVYATTRSFLDDFGLKTLDALPPMHELTSQKELDIDDQAPATHDDVESSSAEAVETLDERAETGQDAPPDTGDASLEDDAHPHAETALTLPLSFADLEARLAARAAEKRDPPASTDKRSDDHEPE
ncbi:SMC-Scp complex subunit ScpB [Halomonas sp. GD1P12]|uniref:SMC-Scp complex subunit ScpB n=1 Tax=Halomonas sp. GD1P12 TaxID=2982691 RepID=UPI0021E35BB5|nr:SMC-Scp complex subunit ScpB [Halomonas sp. GD1P12]UYG00518.1 SMC-Scp complex subunit ScpB [Halomonas sp. GD1P12]